MKKLLLAVVVSMAVVSLPAFAHHPAADNENMPLGTWESIDDNLEDVESPHLELTFEDTMGSSDEMGSDGMDQSGDEPGLAQISDGDQTSSGDENGAEDAGEDNPGLAEEPQVQVGQYRPGETLVTDEYSNPEQTETIFRTEVSTPSAKNKDGVIKLCKGDKLRIASQLRVDEEDVGESARCLVVAQYRSNADEEEASTFMLSEDGWHEWGGNISDLTGVECQLRTNHRIEAHNDVIPPGEFKINFGYQLRNGDIVHSPEALSFTVE